MNEQQEHRIRDIEFNSNADFRRWRWKLIKIYFFRLMMMILVPRKAHVYAAFMLEIQKTDSFRELNKRYQAKIFKP